MSVLVRDGSFDVLIAAGPRLDQWPTIGARTISAICAKAGLSVGVFGGDSVVARGVIPLPVTGGLVLLEDVQGRVHRIRARAVVRLTAPNLLPDPFPGWWSEGLIPLGTARRLKSEAKVSWGPATVILGTGNRALRFGADLLRTKSAGEQVYCVEAFAAWGGKRFSGWEVERRRFEMLGGVMLEGKPVRLSKKAPLLWEFRIEDERGVRVIEVARVVSAGPFREEEGLREFPHGSMLFDLENSALAEVAADQEGYVIEEQRAKLLAAKLVRSLSIDPQLGREELERLHRRARAQLKRVQTHRMEPFTPNYQGKWIASNDSQQMRAFSGVPKSAQKSRPIASIECFENVACNLCEQACPEGAIQFGSSRDAVLSEKDCTACGKCLTVCPSGSPVLIHEREDKMTSVITLEWRGPQQWKVGDLATLLNRRGETLGSGRVSGLLEDNLVQVEVPQHLLWEARALKYPKPPAEVFDVREPSGPIVEITLNGERRLVRDKIPVTAALFEIGEGRSEDVLFCPDGSCGLCRVRVDGVKKLACKTPVHPKMAIRLPDAKTPPAQGNILCACLGITREQVEDRISQGKLSSPEAVLSAVRVGEGLCHGQLCGGAFRRLLADSGIDCEEWADWRFPWTEWVIAPGAERA